MVGFPACSKDIYPISICFCVCVGSTKGGVGFAIYGFTRHGKQARRSHKEFDGIRAIVDACDQRDEGNVILSVMRSGLGEILQGIACIEWINPTVVTIADIEWIKSTNVIITSSGIFHAFSPFGSTCTFCYLTRIHISPFLFVPHY